MIFSYVSLLENNIYGDFFRHNFIYAFIVTTQFESRYCEFTINIDIFFQNQKYDVCLVDNNGFETFERGYEL